jgi:hypothetical protein
LTLRLKPSFTKYCVKYLHVPKLFEICAHTRLAGLPKVAKAGGKRGRPAAAAVLVELIGYIAVTGVVYIGL